MPQVWHSLKLSSKNENSLEARAVAHADSPWFDGHFPGRPLLPGIALIDMAFEVVREREARLGKRIRLKAVRRVRFKKPGLPDEPLNIQVKREQKENAVSYSFTILLGGEVGCTGIFYVESIGD